MMSDPTASPSPAARTQFPVAIKLTLVMLVLIAGIAIYGISKVSGRSSSRSTSSAIERVLPTEDDKILQQDPVGVDLAAGYDAELELNGIPIPDDELNRTPQLDLIEFIPGPGKAVEQYQPGRNCALVTYWPLAAGREQYSTFSWCFTVV